MWKGMLMGQLHLLWGSKVMRITSSRWIPLNPELCTGSKLHWAQYGFADQ